MATQRRVLKCIECSATTVTRSAIAHLDYQEFAFPCPKCNIEIRFGMRLNQEKPSIEYVQEKNLSWADGAFDGEYEKKLDVEHLLKKGDVGHFMPFMVNAFNSPDIEKAFQRHGERFHASRVYWPTLERANVHHNKMNWVLFDKNMKELGYDEKDLAKGRLATLVYALDAIGVYAITDDGVARSKVMKLLRSLTLKGPERQLVVDYYKSGRKGAALWRQLHALRKLWHEKVYYILSPLYLALEWDQSAYPLDQYELCQKRFEELKGFYVDCFETFCRLSVLASAIEGAMRFSKLEVSLGCGIDKLEEAPNGNKHTFLKKLDVADLFVPFIDSRLRNGLGHHSAAYDVTRDCVIYENHSPKKGAEQFSINYIRFCEKIARLYGQLESVAPMANFLRVNYPDDWFY